MDKKRAVIVLSPKITLRHHLCTVVSLSTTAPEKVMPYHCQIDINPPLPSAKFTSTGIWVKGDMVNAVGFHRLELIRTGKDRFGDRTYYYNRLDEQTLKKVTKCVLHGMGFSNLVKHL